MFDEKLFIEPPKPIKNSTYVCDKIFLTDPIIKLYEKSEYCGLIFISGDRFIVSKIDLNHLVETQLESKTVKLPNDHNKGGQSAQRFDRNHKLAIIHYLKMIAESFKNHFEKLNIPVVIGGNGIKKKLFLNHVPTYLKEKIIGLITMTKSTDFDLYFGKVKELYTEKQIQNENFLLSKFTTELDNDSNKIVYGKREISKALVRGELQCIFLSPSQINSKTQKIAQEVGCKLIPIQYSPKGQLLISQFEIFGVKWY